MRKMTKITKSDTKGPQIRSKTDVILKYLLFTLNIAQNSKKVKCEGPTDVPMDGRTDWLIVACTRLKTKMGCNYRLSRKQWRKARTKLQNFIMQLGAVGRFSAGDQVVAFFPNPPIHVSILGLIILKTIKTSSRDWRAEIGGVVDVVNVVNIYVFWKPVQNCTRDLSCFSLAVSNFA